jgi:hypothetical protein
MLEAVSTSETSVNFYQALRRNIPEDGHIHAGGCENLKYHLLQVRSLERLRKTRNTRQGS